MDSDSLWHGDLPEDLARTVRQTFARAAFVEFSDGKSTEERFLISLQRFLCVPEPKAQNRFGKHLFNPKDRELIGELVQLSTLSKSKSIKRKRGNTSSSTLLRHYAVSLATFLYNERPRALRKEVELRVYQLMAIDGGEFIQSRRTIEKWLAQFFVARRKPHKET
ncbi:MAG TPA: hypothetical protein VGE46_00345 [Bdellovibrio sp.]